MRKSINPAWIGIMAVVSGVWAGPALAAVNTLEASITADVEELVNGEVLNADRAFESFGQTTGTLPLIAEVRVPGGDPDGAFEATGGAAAIAIFSDPRTSVLPDPDEFGLSVAAYSRAADTAYTGETASTETRGITFTATEMGLAADTPLEARSQFFVDGVLLIWGEPGRLDLAEVEAELTLSVRQAGTGADDGEVLSAAIALFSSSAGAAGTSVEGALSDENVVLLDLTGEVDGLGILYALVLPDLSIPYTYPAAVDEPFTLTADIAGTVYAPPGCGAAVLLGVPADDLPDLLTEVLGTSSGDALQSRLARAVADGVRPAKPLTDDGLGTQVVARSDDADTSRTLPCAPLGVELWIGLAACGLGFRSLGRHRGAAPLL